MRGMYITQAVIQQKSVWQQAPESICRSATPTAEPTGQPQCWTAFTGRLNPVSTNRISGGFQKVIGFTNGTENQSNLVASLFGTR